LRAPILGVHRLNDCKLLSVGSDIKDFFAGCDAKREVVERGLDERVFEGNGEDLLAICSTIAGVWVGV
jgi:hypothetical protein